MFTLMYTLYQGNVAILGKEWPKNQVLYSQQIDIKTPMYKVYFRVNMKSNLLHWENLGTTYT